MASDYSWIYLAIFLIIPLSRIIPRLLAKKRMKNNTSEIIQEKQIQPSFDKYSREPQREFSKPQREFSKPQTKNMLVLGELNRGSKTFESIQKNTDLDNKELNTILEDLEKNGMLKVHQKQGLLGPKIELYLTDKGFKEYNS
jgi:hypothetical protein